MKRTGSKESRFKKHVNHCISKKIVRLAEGTKRGIGLEDLKGIHSRTRLRKSQRARMQRWSFGQLREFVEYKARMAGVPVVVVDPRNTSRTCFQCGHCEKANRRSQDKFKCRACGHVAHADHNAALNIGAAAVTVNTLKVSERHKIPLAG